MRRLGSFFHAAMNGMAARDKMFAILDEPTGNHDSLNEAVILKVLRDEGAGRTVAVVWECRFLIYF
jgi:ABC-type transport system involved in cytochrome bd biosynthesis fused ATPase/permease subunit